METFRFLGSAISQDLKWVSDIDSVRKKARQRMYSTSTSITVWFESATKQDRNRLQRTVRTAERITDADLPSIRDLYMSRVREQAGKITAHPSHPGQNLFQLLSSGRCYRAPYAKTTRHVMSGTVPVTQTSTVPVNYSIFSLFKYTASM